MIAADRAQQLAAMPYELYLATPEWAALRRAVLQRDGHRCRVCNGPDRLEVHHRTYERRGHEDLDDLTTLCHACHNGHHAAARKRAKPAPIGHIRHVPGATLWTIPARPQGYRRPRLRVLPGTRRRWHRTRRVTRVAWLLVAIGVVALLLNCHATAV